jgi:hypothetical protein
LKVEKKIEDSLHIPTHPYTSLHPGFSLSKMEASHFLGPVLAITPGKTIHLCYYEIQFSGMKFSEVAI